MPQRHGDAEILITLAISGKMKILFTILCIVLAVSSVSFEQTLEVKDHADSTKVDTVGLGQTLDAKDSISSTLVDSMCKMKEIEGKVYIGLNTSYSLIDHSNSYYALSTGFYSKHMAYETSILNLSTIKNNGIRYYSSNSLPVLVMLPFVIVEAICNSKKEESGWLTLMLLGPIIGLPATAVGLSNIKLGYQLNENVVLLAGQQTDYYLFYHVSKICTQSQVGTRIFIRGFNVNAFYNIPWKRGYSDNKDPFISLGIGYGLLKKVDDFTDTTKH